MLPNPYKESKPFQGDDTVPVLKSGQIQFITECIDGWKFIIAATFRLPGYVTLSNFKNNSLRVKL